MKKILILLLSLLMCNSLNFANINNDDKRVLLSNEIICENKIIITDLEFRYYPFIYSADKSHELWNETIIGDNNCQEGYFYCKDMFSGSIKKLIDKPIEKFYVDNIYNENTWYYFIYENAIYKINSLGDILECLYDGNKLTNNAFSKHDNIIIFCDDDIVKTIDLKNNIINSYFKQTNIDKIRYSNISNSIVYAISSKYYIYNIDTKETKIINEDEIQSLFSESMIPSALNINLLTVGSTLPFNTYFNSKNPNSACDDHPGNGSCGTYCSCYGGAWQCYGYARKAYDLYSHKTSWQLNLNDTKLSQNIDISTTADLLAFINNYLREGSYFRTGNGLHTFFYVKKTSTKIYTYECNTRNQECKITSESRTLDNFVSLYTRVIEYSTHDYSLTAIDKDNTYHKYCCLSSGCTGYILENHTFTTIAGVEICTICGHRNGGIYE